MPKRAEAELHSRIRSPLFLGNNSMGNRCANFTESCRDALDGEIEQIALLKLPNRRGWPCRCVDRCRNTGVEFGAAAE
jgi:hypothetical protein